MKLILPAMMLLACTFAYAKKDRQFKNFNKEMMENISTVLKDNPELYETKDIHRKPASVSPVEEVTTEKLDQIEEQADGRKSW